MENREPTSVGADQRELRFGSPQQMELLAVVRARNPLLGQCYEGALRALSDEANPESLTHTAHSTRELVDYLPLAVRDRVPKKPPDLKGMVQAVVDDWQRAIRLTSNVTTEGWKGEIDVHLRRLLQRIARFVEWFELDHPKHGAEQDMILDEFDPASRRLPKQLRDSRGDRIRRLQRYMNGVAHHNVSPNRTEFIQRFTEVDVVLRELFKPEPLADRKLMDDILRVGQ